MHSGFYTIASGILTNQRELDVIGNNLSNVNTPGYQAGRVATSSFEMRLQEQYENGGARVLGDGTGSPIALVDEETTVTSNGVINTTGRTLDFALSGEGYFNVQGADGTTYLTRNGQFVVDDQGYLTLAGVGRVQGTGGALLVGGDNVTVDESGNVYNGAGTYVGTLAVTRPADNTALERMDNGMFTAPQGAVNAQGYQVVQGAVEQSNVDMNQEMTNLIAVQRAFQSCSSALQIMDGMDRKAATQIGSIQG